MAGTILELSESEETPDLDDLLDPATVLTDYRLAVESRQVSLIGRR